MRKLSVNESNRLRKTIGSNIAKARNKKGLTQEQLADMLDTDRVTVAYAEIGKRTPKVSTLYQMAKALDVKASSFLSGL